DSRLSVDDSAELDGEMHRVRIIDRHAPAHNLAGAARSVFGRMAFLDIAGLIHRRHDKKVTVRPFLTGDTPCVGVENSVFEWLWIDLAVVPVRRLRRAMQPLQMILIDGVFNHLKKITVDGARAQRP